MRGLHVLALIVVCSCTGAHDVSTKGRDLRSHPGVRLIEDYVSGDIAGRRLHHDLWFANAVIWEDEPAYDQYSAVRDVALTPISADSSTARVQVQYDVLGTITSTASDSLVFEASHTAQVIVFTAVLTDNGWRIAAPQQAFRVRAETLLTERRLLADSRTRLAALMR